MGAPSDTFTTVGIWASIVGAGGVAIAVVQLVRTKKSVDAAKAAINRTESRLASNKVLMLLPRLQGVEGDLDSAVAQSSPDAVVRHLNNWRQLATEICGLIDGQPYADPEQVITLRASAITAATVKAQIVGGSVTDLARTTKALRTEIASGAAYAGTLTGILQKDSLGD